MKKNNILLLVTSDQIITKFKEESNITFLFPLQDFSVGFERYFTLNEITAPGFIFVNRLLDNAGIEEFRTLLPKLPKTIQGIVFDDLGILNILQTTKINIRTILFLNHLNCNYESINAYLDYVDSCVICPDINALEIDEILNHTKKPLVLFTFGYVNIMYSRRTLITNYNKYFNQNSSSISTLEEKMSHKNFKIVENKYGTVIYPAKPFNGLSLKSKPHVLYNLIMPLFLNEDEITKILTSTTTLDDKYPYKYLLEQEMTIKVKGGDGS